MVSTGEKQDQHVAQESRGWMGRTSSWSGSLLTVSGMFLSFYYLMVSSLQDRVNNGTYTTGLLSKSAERIPVVSNG